MDGASNIVTFLGLAEVILRAGSKVYDFIVAIQDAPQEIRNLQHELNGITLLLSELKEYWNDLSKVQSWSCPSSFIDNCISSLRNIHQDLNVLATAAMKHDSSRKIASTWAKIKWTFEGKQVVKLTRSLERHKLFLVTALAVDGKRMQLYYQQELKRCVLQSSEQILSSNETIKGLQILSISGQASLGLEAPHRTFSASVADSGFQSTPNIHRGPTTRRRKALARTAPRSKKLDALHADVKHLSVMLGRFDASSSPVSCAHSFSEDREEMLLSLLLLRPQINSAIKSLLAEQHPVLSIPQLEWLSSEFSILYTAVMQDNDDLATYKRIVPGAAYTDFVDHTSSFYGGRTFTEPASTCIARHRGELRHKRAVVRIWRFESAVSRLDIRRTTTSSDEVTDEYEDLGFTFIPFLDMPAIAITANFQKIDLRTRSPQIQRQLHTYRILPYRECRELYKLLETGTLREIDDAFRHGRTSLYVLDFLGRSVHYPAARAGRLDVLKYLADQGFGPATIDAGSHALRGLCELWRNQAYSPSRRHKRRDDIFRWLIDSGCDVNYSVPQSAGPVQYDVPDTTNFFFPESVSLFQHWITMLMQEGYDLETRNFVGETALLAHAGAPGAYNTQVIQSLLTSGADPKATNPRGFNSLVCAMLSAKNSRERYRVIVSTKLRRLIAGGCDINQCDFMGLTPSQHAVKSSCWYEWCSALDYNGLKIHEVIDASKAQQKASSFRRYHKNNLPSDHSTSSQSRISRSPRLLAIDSYDRWKRMHIATSVKAMHALPHSDYSPLLDLCNDSNISAGFCPWEEYDALYENIKDLFVDRKDLFNVLHALNRTLRKVWDDPELYKIRRWGLSRIEDSIDEAIMILRTTKNFYYCFYVTSQ